MADKLKSKGKVDHPEAQFDKPKEVVQDKTMSRHEQKKALNTWEQDERQLLTASNEGMAGREEGLQSDDGNRLDEVVTTKERSAKSRSINHLISAKGRDHGRSSSNGDLMRCG